MALRVVTLIVLLAISGRCAAILIAPRTVQGSPHLSADAAAHAFQQGIEAAALGQALSSCPYTGDDAARAWRAGWRWWSGS